MGGQFCDGFGCHDQVVGLPASRGVEAGDAMEYPANEQHSALLSREASGPKCQWCGAGGTLSKSN